MSLQDRLMADLKDSMRSGDTIRKDAIRMIRAAIQNAEIELQRKVSDEEVIQIISREIKKREEALVMFRQGRREDLVTTEEAGIRVLQGYLPEQLSQDQIVAAVEQIIGELGATGPAQMGPVMREAMARLKGRVDGRLVNQIVREALSR